jgi:hypothetical protein
MLPGWVLLVPSVQDDLWGWAQPHPPWQLLVACLSPLATCQVVRWLRLLDQFVNDELMGSSHQPQGWAGAAGPALSVGCIPHAPVQSSALLGRS